MWRLDAGYWSDQGDRENNEDCAEVLDNGRVAMIADGMGGRHGGGLASRLAVEAVRHFAGTSMPPEATEETVFPWFKRIFQAANQRILDAGRDDVDLQEMGTTLTLGLIQDGRLFFGHMGDSRLYRWREGHGEQLTEDHTEAQEFVRQGWFSSEEAARSRYHHILTRWLGTIRALEPQLGSCEVQEGDRLLLCTDGFYDQIEASNLSLLLGAEQLSQEVAEKLVRTARKSGRPRQDNITALVVRLEG